MQHAERKGSVLEGILSFYIKCNNLCVLYMCVASIKENGNEFAYQGDIKSQFPFSNV